MVFDSVPFFSPLGRGPLPLDAHWASVTDLPSFDLFKGKLPPLLLLRPLLV